MISDVLAEAVERINEYLRLMPSTYQDESQALRSLVVVMDAMRLVLDSPPTLPPPTRDMRDTIRDMIGGLPAGDLLTVMMRYLGHTSG